MGHQRGLPVSQTTRFPSSDRINLKDGLPAGFIPPGGIVVPVGSRVTCSPPPTDTDEDYLVLVNDVYQACKGLKALGFSYEVDDEKIKEYLKMMEGSAVSFCSMRFGEINYIIVESPFFFERFLTATHVAKKLNLLNKEDRIMVFHAIRGGSFAKEVYPAMDRIMGSLVRENNVFKLDDGTVDGLLEATAIIHDRSVPF
jgi:hypothetical protein